MKTKLILLFVIFSFATISQETGKILTGVVIEKNESGEFTPLIGSSVYWLGTKSGTITDVNGVFKLPTNSNSKKLIVSYIGFIYDTLEIIDQSKVNIILKTDPKQVAEVVIEGKVQSTIVSYLTPQKTLVMTEKELFKAACCNLSESFETNPSIDVSFSDAITGAKQIEMLGLAGSYTQITTENLPSIRGLASNVGLTFVPGTWIENIQVSKGVGSVVNGYESITGQINVELRKPQNEEESKLFFNFYGNRDYRMEGNLNYRQKINDNIYSMTLLHQSGQNKKIDFNGDSFLDMPTYNTTNVFQKFHFTNLTGLEGQLGIHYVDEQKIAGNENSFLVNLNTNQFRVYGKTGYVFPAKEYQSVGLQWSISKYKQNSKLGNRNYLGTENTGYINLIYQSIIDNSFHKFRTGLSFLFDEFDEIFDEKNYNRLEKTPGAFFEYTFDNEGEISLVAGARVDNHNLYGLFFTPRLHLRFKPNDDYVFRFIAGSGTRSQNIFSENISYLLSNRNLVIKSENENYGYGFKNEKAWNFGLNMMRYFLFNDLDANFSIDFYRTNFDNQIVANLDKPRTIEFINLKNGSYSNSIQLELNIQPFKNFETKTAYRYLDVKQYINGVWIKKPFVAEHRTFINLAYSTERDSKDEPQMLYDLTIQWFSPKRLPDTKDNPTKLKAREFSPSFALANTQITRSFFDGFDLYLGIENIFNFMQHHPIISYDNPSSEYFDSSLIWGPIYGRLVYLGLRYRI